MTSIDAELDLVPLADRLAEVVGEAGAIAARLFKGGGAERWSKADDSPVTEADIAVDRYLAERLPPLAPGSGWLSEETADTPERLDRRRVWIVDPIDGTRAFVDGVPEWVVSVALVEDGRPIAGIVHNPVRGVTHAAVRGGGATLNGRPLTVSDSHDLEGARVGGTRSLISPLKTHGVVEGAWIYALANRLVKVADGTLEAALARPAAHDWDIAAAHLILEEAGAVLTDFDGAAPTYNRRSTRQGALVAAAPHRHAALLAAISAEPELVAAAKDKTR
ncbi:3'(2'),5'-bisphosphate nucleotidase CysQ [Methylopila turkensis]|uniref:3'(2'),5'-bisphosphate nucleotidase CysQ n=1 Tax=Methylopila turkensis TaxID=1437816 RepID=A0A9W6JK80_9HYPH|nr:3'(2'),5'-bisphosphate nucleotidase CysQ [Methylopila turkensis]GLK78737.1 3'(2'),5'-bisphosphate nucleotidase CysQ [Methylopila turkensis]